MDQLFIILQQTLQDTMQRLAARSQQPPQQEGVLRIWMGNGESRNDLTPGRLRSLLNALQEPVTKKLIRLNMLDGTPRSRLKSTR